MTHYPKSAFGECVSLAAKTRVAQAQVPNAHAFPRWGDAPAVRCLERTASTGEGARATRFSIKLPATAF